MVNKKYIIKTTRIPGEIPAESIDVPEGAGSMDVVKREVRFYKNGHGKYDLGGLKQVMFPGAFNKNYDCVLGADESGIFEPVFRRARWLK